jgi:hypothetical protein
MRDETHLLQAGTTTGIVVPDEVRDALGGGRERRIAAIGGRLTA